MGSVFDHALLGLRKRRNSDWVASLLSAYPSPSLFYAADRSVFSDAGTTPITADATLLYRVNDQSGNARYGEQATEGKRPLIKLAQQNGKPSIRFDGVDNILRSTSFALAQPFTIYLVANNTTPATTGRFYDGNTVNDSFLFAASGGQQQYAIYAGGVACQGEGSVDAEIFAAVFNGASSLLECGERAGVTGDPGAQGIGTGLCFGAAGNESGGFFLAYDLFAAIVYPAAHNEATRDAIRAILRRAWGTIPQVRCEGDSITFGTGSTAGNDYPSQLAALLGAGYDVVNDGSGGDTADAMATTAQLHHGRYCSGLRTTYAVLWAGTNDILFGATAAEVYADLKAWWATMRANGAYVIAVNIIERGNFDAGMETIRQATNVLIDSDPSLYDARVDVASRVEFSDPNDVTYFSDTIHLTDAGYTVVAGLVNAAIASI